MSERSEQIDGFTKHVKEQVLSCPICIETYTAIGDQSPKVLPCHHGICQKCATSLAAKSGGSKIQCPTCRKVSKIPVAGGVSSLPNNYVIHELLDIAKRHGEDKSATDVVQLYSSRKRRALTCGYCDNPTTESSCMGCDECDCIWCSDCRDIHLRGKMYKSHKLLPYNQYLDKIDLRLASAIPTTGLSMAAMRCKKHNSKDIDIYCVECGEMLCLICFASDHSEHHMVLIQDAAKSKIQKLGEICDVVKERRKISESNANTAGTKRIIYERHLAGLEANIRANGQKLHAVISEKEQEALREVRERTATSVDRLASEQHRHEDMAGRIRKSIKEAETVIQCGCDFDICRSAPDVEDSLRTLLNEMDQGQQEKQQRDKLQGHSPRLTISFMEAVKELMSPTTRLFSIVEEDTTSLNLPDVSTVNLMNTAMAELLKALQSTPAPQEPPQALRCTVMHMLDGVYSLARIDRDTLGEIGATDLCSQLVQLLAWDSVRQDAVLAETGLRVVEALGQFRADTSCNSTTNVSSLIEAGACKGNLAAWKSGFFYVSVAIMTNSVFIHTRPLFSTIHDKRLHALITVIYTHLARISLDKYLFGLICNSFFCPEVIAILRLHGVTSLAVCEAGLLAVGSLAVEAAAVARFIDVGAPEGALAVE